MGKTQHPSPLPPEPGGAHLGPKPKWKAGGHLSLPLPLPLFVSLRPPPSATPPRDHIVKAQLPKKSWKLRFLACDVGFQGGGGSESGIQWSFAGSFYTLLLILKTTLGGIGLPHSRGSGGLGRLRDPRGSLLPGPAAPGKGVPGEPHRKGVWPQAPSHQ